MCGWYWMRNEIDKHYTILRFSFLKLEPQNEGTFNDLAQHAILTVSYHVKLTFYLSKLHVIMDEMCDFCDPQKDISPFHQFSKPLRSGICFFMYI